MPQPSRSTRAGWEPLVCYRCDGRVFMNGPKAEEHRGAMFSLVHEKDLDLPADTSWLLTAEGWARARHGTCARVRVVVDP